MRALHPLLEARQVLLDPRTRIFTEEGGDHVRELATRRIVLEGYAHEGAAVGPWLESHGPSGLDSRPFRAPGDQLVRLVVDDLCVPLERRSHRPLDHPV